MAKEPFEPIKKLYFWFQNIFVMFLYGIADTALVLLYCNLLQTCTKRPNEWFFKTCHLQVSVR